MPLIPHLFYNSRDYRVFSILANVRNGTKTEEPFNVIAEPRGVPEDMSPLGQEMFGDGEGTHDGSWLLVEEIFQFDWSQTAQFVGFVDNRFAHLFEGNPVGYPREQMKRLQNRNSNENGASITVGPAASMSEGVQVRWQETYLDATRDFKSKVKRYRCQSKPESTRLVMWFGS